MKTNTIKTMFGIVLILFAVSGLIFWEAEGREILLMDEVLVAKEDIKEGELFDPEKFRIESVPFAAIVDQAVAPGNAGSLAGEEASYMIIKGTQLSKRHYRKPAAGPKPDTSFFVVRNEWIHMCTSSLRRGDEVLVTSADGRDILGRFTVAYVKDSEGREVTDAQSGIYSFSGTTAESDRVNTSAPIHHVEIACELKDYRRMLDYCAGKLGSPLMLIRITSDE